ncbi:metallophosphoesterase [Solirubrobacter ginsenosidimutans]|uniref:Metallophosphoesterase n=1 Tax=Solirubrobacter ginsenosidimutans TaxID=490573 RepID=A0A9X3S530_9ACTN|nr:metallophosphoesterase [Solirubrobacter ginsenosidimutans]MDA0165152.1 metallophosphoesterase [Solirubrobacter ginsenosidimutans]
MTPTLIAQLSDPHIRLDDAVSQAALAAGVARVLTLNPLPTAVLVTGDIANSGDPREHARALELLAPLPMPVHRLAGNHDLFGERTRYAVDAKGVRIIACDTSIPGRDDGTLELDWLAERLAEDRDTPTIVAMHHPPLRTGLAWLDEIGLPSAERSALGELLVAAPNVRRVVAGHVHRVIHDTLGGCGVITCASTNIQSGLDFIATEMVLTSEPPSLLVHALLDSGDLVTHVQAI